jgi:hypothetical protein
MSGTGSDARRAWHTSYRMDRMFDRIITTDGWGWLGLRAALWCSECGREVTTPPLPLNAASGAPLKALHAAFVTHLSEKCEPTDRYGGYR